MPIRLVIAEDNLLVREGVRELLGSQPDLEVAAVCGDLDSLLDLQHADRARLVLGVAELNERAWEAVRRA